MSPKFSDAAEAEFSRIVSRYPKKEAALLSVLWLAQREFGALSREVREFVAGLLGLSAARVESVVSFYTMYSASPRGKFHVQVCRNLSCSLRGCETLMGLVEEQLGLRPGETSPDGLFAYSTVECLAACGGAPALHVNERCYENVTKDSLRKLIEDLRSHGTDR
ncbi:MAG: NAD(P)H-dependent oxidoreductase subunit E [Pseudomonadota bacterium]